MMRKFCWHIFIPIVLVLFYSCANQVAPKGGPVDEQPPTLVKAIPANTTTLFDATTVTLVFDEFITLTYPDPTFSITPTIPQEQFAINVKKNQVILHLPDTLLPNTTYQINFGNALKDLNEGNVFQNFSYVFATGATLDSLNLSFQVKDAFTLQPLKGITVGLYPYMSTDSSLTNNKPPYYLQSNDEEKTRFSYLPKDSFIVIAFRDNNNDAIYQPTKEAGGFIKRAIAPAKTPNTETLYLSPPTPRTFTIATQQQKAGHFILTTSQPLNTAKDIHCTGLAECQIIKATPDSFSLYYWPLTIDSFFLSTQLDSAKYNDTLYPRKYPPFDSIFTMQTASFSIENNGYTIHFSSEYPFRHIDTQAITLLIDSMPTSTHRWILSEGKLHAEIPVIPFGDTITYQIPPKAITNWIKQTNRPASGQLIVPPADHFGSWTLMLDSTITSQYPTHIYAQTPSGEIWSCLDCRQWHKKYVPPGNYKIWIVIDKNDNGQWDAGGWYQRTLPEPVIRMENTLTIRSNWENNMTITTP